jgi:hypothetical protein
MVHQMILIIISALIYLGCAAKPVIVEFSTAHPANPLAQEASILQLPNPFMDREESVAIDQESKDSMGHGNMQMKQHTGHDMTKEPHQKPMKHSTDKQEHQGHK